MEGRAQVCGDDRIPFILGKFLDRRDELDAGIVDENIDGTGQLCRLRAHVIDLVRLGHIGAVIEDLDPELLFHAGANFFDLARVTEAVEHDVRAFSRQSARDAVADAAGGAGDECCFALEHVKSPFVAARSYTKRGGVSKVP